MLCSMACKTALYNLVNNQHKKQFDMKDKQKKLSTYTHIMERYIMESNQH